jgi:hypothetical protein
MNIINILISTKYYLTEEISFTYIYLKYNTTIFYFKKL